MRYRMQSEVVPLKTVTHKTTVLEQCFSSHAGDGRLQGHVLYQCSELVHLSGGSTHMDDIREPWNYFGRFHLADTVYEGNVSI